MCDVGQSCAIARAICVTFVGVVLVETLSGFEFGLARSQTLKSLVVIMVGQIRTSDAPKPPVTMHLDFPARCPIGRECRLLV